MLFSSCASIVSHSSWPLTVNSNPSGATITISNRSGAEVYKGTTPANVMLKSGAKFFKRESYKIHFQLAGYDIKDIPVECKVNGWYWGNIVLGGVIGWLIVDPATGAMYKLDATAINESLTKTSASIDPEHKLNVCSINDLPQSVKEHLVKIN